MKTFSIILMVVGFVLAFFGSGIAGHSHASYHPGGLAIVIFGSSLFGSGVIALAITQAFGKKS